jgi:uncharacterized protein
MLRAAAVFILFFFSLYASQIDSHAPFQEAHCKMVNNKTFLSSQSFSSKITAHVFRLRPGQDFIEELTRLAKQKQIKAGTILSVVGSFTHINLRYANQPTGTAQEGHFEIVSLVGTFNDASYHIHCSVSNDKGQTFGGHMLIGNLIYTTAEVVIAEMDNLIFSREKDEESAGGSGWNELVIKPSDGAALH